MLDAECQPSSKLTAAAVVDRQGAGAGPGSTSTARQLRYGRTFQIADDDDDAVGARVRAGDNADEEEDDDDDDDDASGMQEPRATHHTTPEIPV